MFNKKVKYRTLMLGLLVVASASLTSGCSVYTINKSPEPSVQLDSYFSLPIAQGEQFTKPWWESFERNTLNELMEQSFDNNFDVAAASARLNQALAISRQTNAARLPQVDARGNAAQDWEGSDAKRGTAEIGAALSWELDIWNRIGASVKADRMEAQARAEEISALKLSLSAELANAYFGAVAAQKRIDLLRKQLKLDRDLLKLLQLRQDSGVGTSVDVLQQKARVADSQTLIPLAEADLIVFENRLDVLLGEMPDGEMRIDKTETLKFIENMPIIGVPAALLISRPDLRAKQAELIAADADIASAIADRLPRITLDGSAALADGATYSGPVSMIMGSFVQPLLDWGQRKAEVDRNKALYEERMAAYTQAYIEAVEDVENALIREKKQREFLKKLNAQRWILQKTAKATEDRYTQGVDDYLPVINALQELRDVQRDLIDEQLKLVSIRIDLFRSIGGPIYTPAKAEIQEQDHQEGYDNDTP